MSVSLPNGATIHIASGYVAADTVTAITNANPGVVTTSAAHGITDGKFIEVTSGWSRLTGKIVRVISASGSSLSLEGYDTSSTSIYPAGGGVGSIREISGWTQLQQVLTTQSNGGEQEFTEYRFLEAAQRVRIPTDKSPSGLTISIADDPTLAGYILASTANDDRLPRAVKITLASGSILLYNAYISLNKTPSLTVNEVMACQMTLSLLNEPVRYAS